MTLPATSTRAQASSPDLLVQKSITVAAPRERAFRVFTEKMGSWWPLASHHIGKVEANDAVIEPFVGGRWFERCVDGSECEWGRVLAWDPPHRLVLSWEISYDWKHDASLQTQVEVRFVAEGNATRVELEHRLLQNYGEHAELMQGIFNSPGGWSGLLQAFAEHAGRA